MVHAMASHAALTAAAEAFARVGNARGHRPRDSRGDSSMYDDTYLQVMKQER